MVVKTNGIPFFRVGAPPVLGFILVGIGMFTGGTIWVLTHGHRIAQKTRWINFWIFGGSLRGMSRAASLQFGASGFHHRSSHDLRGKKRTPLRRKNLKQGPLSSPYTPNARSSVQAFLRKLLVRNRKEIGIPQPLV